MELKEILEKYAYSQYAASQAHQDILDWVEKKFIPKIDDWKCDNVNCGKGAICNFCAVKQKISALKSAIQKRGKK